MPPGTYNYLGNDVVYTDDGLIRNPVLNCLAGASFPLRKGVETIMKFSICTPAEAMNLAAKNVSMACRLSDRGALEPRKRADLILFSIKDNKVTISKVLVKGRVVYTL
jgi:N-acetylglucosamine-6-phosphate deacetylase